MRAPLKASARSISGVEQSGVVVPPNNGTNNKAPVCFAQLKSRPVNDPTASKVNAVHTFWWVQGTNGRAIISAGPQSYQGGSSPYLEAWVVPGNSNGADNSGQHLVFNTGVSSDVCGQVDSMINSASQFPRRSFYYNPVWGPNSNTAAKYFGNTAGFQPSFPFNAYGSGAPLLVP